MDYLRQNNTQRRIPNTSRADGIKIQKPEISGLRPDYNRLIERLDHLRTLEEGWDLCDAKSPSEKAIKNVRLAIQLLDDEILKECAIFPNGDGGLYVTCKFNDQSKFIAYFGDSDVTYVARNGEEKVEVKPTSVSVNTLSVLEKNIKSVCLKKQNQI